MLNYCLLLSVIVIDCSLPQASFLFLYYLSSASFGQKADPVSLIYLAVEHFFTGRLFIISCLEVTLVTILYYSQLTIASHLVRLLILTTAYALIVIVKSIFLGSEFIKLMTTECLTLYVFYFLHHISGAYDLRKLA